MCVLLSLGSTLLVVSFEVLMVVCVFVCALRVLFSFFNFFLLKYNQPSTSNNHYGQQEEKFQKTKQTNSAFVRDLFTDSHGGKKRESM